ncbi:MAG TPA: hypothetical protein VLT36_13165 [Candidatus Dormibacteraeota bacterium]|nr:hypothetical protein [Candidatus Dormibacteraeota bacterium]
MGLDATTRRRWVGAIAVAGALGMLILGETALKDRLHDLGLLGYWLICLLLTATAIVVAFLDARSLRVKIHREQRSLLEKTLKDIESEARSRRRPGQNAGN